MLCRVLYREILLPHQFLGKEHERLFGVVTAPDRDIVAIVFAGYSILYNRTPIPTRMHVYIHLASNHHNG